MRLTSITPTTSNYQLHHQTNITSQMRPNGGKGGSRQGQLLTGIKCRVDEVTSITPTTSNYQLHHGWHFAMTKVLILREHKKICKTMQKLWLVASVT